MTQNFAAATVVQYTLGTLIHQTMGVVKNALLAFITGSFLLLMLAGALNDERLSRGQQKMWQIRPSILSNQKRRLQENLKANVISNTNIFIAIHDVDTPASRKQMEALQDAALGSFHVVANTTQQQHAFLQASSCVDGAAERFQLFTRSNHSHLAEEIWKYCSLWKFGGLYLDADTQLLKPSALRDLIHENIKASTEGVGVLMDSFAKNSLHGSFLWLRQSKSNVVLKMAQLLMTTSVFESPLTLPQTLYSLIETNSESQWDLLRQSCSENPFRQVFDQKNHEDSYDLFTCSRFSGLCCFVYKSGDDGRVAMLGSRKPIQPIQRIYPNNLPKPFNQREERASSNSQVEELPFIATLKRQESTEGAANLQEAIPIQNFYDELKDKDCLPSHSCNKCLSDKKHGATCATCVDACPCFCNALCGEEMLKKASDGVQYQATVPRHALDPTRLIPRIVHQTWFEHLDENPKRYPNMSRLTESFKTSGWKWKFYTDEDARLFLSEHFPAQVLQAYDLLLPGAFRADLFRYCCLLIHGGVYADVDTLVGPSLDSAIPPDVGFMVGLDEPGKKIGARMCLWNGFIAATPGHPFLAKAIESVVNNIHRRFTSVDIALMHCPSPEMSIITSFSPLFVAGPCLLGSTINALLGRHRQAQFEAGELPPPKDGIKIPGRTIILDQNKYDMGAHRFTFLELNLIVLSTDFPDSDDREKLDSYEHYSETRVRFEIYGIDGVYKDNHRNSTAIIQINLAE